MLNLWIIAFVGIMNRKLYLYLIDVGMCTMLEGSTSTEVKRALQFCKQEALHVQQKKVWQSHTCTCSTNIPSGKLQKQDDVSCLLHVYVQWSLDRFGAHKVFLSMYIGINMKHIVD